MVRVISPVLEFIKYFNFNTVLYSNRRQIFRTQYSEIFDTNTSLMIILGFNQCQTYTYTILNVAYY